MLAASRLAADTMPPLFYAIADADSLLPPPLFSRRRAIFAVRHCVIYGRCRFRHYASPFSLSFITIFDIFRHCHDTPLTFRHG
jgi:hypothetical protein